MLKLLYVAVIGLVLLPLLVAQSEDGYNANQRILRIRELSKKGPAVLPALEPYLSDPNRDIRIEAVKAIVKIDTDRSLEPLVQATADKDEDIQIRATDGLVNHYIAGYVARGGLTGAMTRGVRQVRGFFSSRNDQVIERDVRVQPEVQKAVAAVVEHGASIEARANAALAAGILRDEAAVPALVQGLHGRDDDLIFESLIALQKIRDPSAGPGVSFLAHDLDERVQSTALETIGRLRSTESAPDVRSALHSARSLRVRRAALEALAMLGLPEDRAVFTQHAGDRDPELRASALEGLGRIREPEDMSILQKAFDEGDADWRVHLAAAFALVNEGKVDTDEFSPLPYLVENLGNKARGDTASAYLVEVASHPEVRAALAKMLPEMDKWQKIALCDVLGSVGTPDTVTMLNGLSRDIDSDVAFAASKALRVARANSAGKAAT